MRRRSPTSRVRTPQRGDRGSGTVMMIGVAALAVTLALLSASLAQVTTIRHRAESLADLAAVSGASSVPASCLVAAQVVSQGGGTLNACATTPEGEIRVEASVAIPDTGRGILSQLPAARARARAGQPPP